MTNEDKFAALSPAVQAALLVIAAKAKQSLDSVDPEDGTDLTDPQDTFWEGQGEFALALYARVVVALAD